MSCFSESEKSTIPIEYDEPSFAYQKVNGKITESCSGIIMIDVMDFSTSDKKPIFFTKAMKNGSFILKIPSDRVSQVHGFCYSSQKEVDLQKPDWKMIPKQIHPSQIPDFLRLERLTNDSSEANASQLRTEDYGNVNENPKVQQFFEEFYGNRLSEKQIEDGAVIIGSYPSRTSSHISLKAFYQYLDSFYALVKQAAKTTGQELIVPSTIEWKSAKQEDDFYGPKTVALLFQLQSACSILEIPCPSWRMVRSEELSILDKTILSSNNTEAKQAALIWIIAEHLAKQSRLEQIDSLPYLPHPLEISVAVQKGSDSDEWKALETKLAEGYQKINQVLPDLNPI